MEGTERNETGKFEVTVLCTNQLNATIPCNCTEPPACANMTMNLTCPNITCAPCPCETVAPTPSPTVAVFSDDCAYQHLTCLDSITDTNQDAPREIGDESGDMYYLLSAFEPQNLTVTVCARQDSIKMRLALFEDYPTRANATAILTSGSHVAQCAELELQILEIGAYWLHVEGNGTDEGVFFLDIACENTPAPSPSPTTDLNPCTWDYLTCSDVERSSNFGLYDIAGDSSGDSIYVLTSFVPKAVTLTTCTSHTDFKTIITVWDGWPGDEESRQIRYDSYRQTGACAMVGFEVPAGSYWVQIEGENGEEGDFELLVLCDEHSALHPTAVPTPVPPVPTMEPTWDCAGRVYTDVTNSSSNVSCATYVDKVLASNNTFDCRGMVTCDCNNTVREAVIGGGIHDYQGHAAPNISASSYYDIPATHPGPPRPP